MKKKILSILIFGIFLFFIFQIQTASSDINASNFTGDSRTGEISAGNATSAGTISEASSTYTYRLTSFLVSVCGDGFCDNISESCLSCVADCGCSAGYTCTAGVCVINPVTIPPTGGGKAPSGGGAAITAVSERFSVSPDTVKVSLTPGSVATKKITITNKLNTPISLSIDEKNLDGLLILNDRNINLNPNESRDISFDIIVREDVPPNLYLGQIVIKSGGTEKKVLIILEVESKGALFDLTVNIPDEYLLMLPGKKLLAETTLINLGAIKKADVLVKYQIKDVNGNEILAQDETMAVETKASTIKEFLIPEGATGGKYVLYARAIYEGKTASSTAEFSVISTAAERIFILLILIFIIVGTLSFAYYYRRKKKKEESGKIMRKMTIKDISRKMK